MQATDFVPVKVNGVIIEEAQLAREMQFYPADTLHAARNEAAKEIVLKTLLQQMAITQGLGDTDEAIDALLEKEIHVEEPSDESCKEYYDSHIEEFVTGSLYAASHILLEAHEEEAEKRAQLKIKARELITQLQESPLLFAFMAESFSACSSKQNGGQLGQFTKGSMVPEFEAAVLSHPVGLVQNPIETTFGIHIIRVDHHDEGRVLPYAYVKKQIVEKLLMLQWHRSVNQYLHVLVAKADIEGVIL